MLKLEGQAPKGQGGGASGNLSMNQTLENHNGSVRVLAWNENYHKLTSSDQYGLIIVWMLHKGMWFEEMINNRNKSFVKAMKWTADGEKICIVYEDGYTIVGSVDGNRLWGKELELQLAHVEWSPDSRTILFATQQGQVHLYDTNGNFIQKMNIPWEESKGYGTIVGMEWYNGSEGPQDPKVPSLVLVTDNGFAYLMRSESDEDPVVIDTGLEATCVKWNHNATVVAVAGAFKGYETSSSSNPHGVHFFSPLGQRLCTLRVPGSGVKSLSWEGKGLRLALAVDQYIYFANVRPDYHWSYFGSTLMYSFSKYDRPEHGVMFWNTENGTKNTKFVKQLLGVKAAGEYAIIATKAEESNQYILILCNTIGAPCDSKYTAVEPKHLAMNKQYVFAANDNSIYSWHFNRQASKLLFYDDNDDESSRELTFPISSMSMQSNDSIADITASAQYLLVACQSGTIIRYSIPSMSMHSKISLDVNVKKVKLSTDAKYLSVISDMGTLSLFTLPEDATGYDRVAAEKWGLERKDVWDVVWAEDIPNQFAVMEKTRMYIYRGEQPEEPISTTAYLCNFNGLQVRTVQFDAIMQNPDSPEQTTVRDLDTKSLRDTAMLLESATIEDALQFVEDNSHPKLWRRLAEYGLKASNFVVADKAFVRCNDYHGIQFLKRLQQLDDPRKQEAEVAAYFADFGKCEEIYMAMDRPDLAIEMRMKLGDWFKVERLLEEGGGDDAMLVKAWNNIGEYYGHRQKWGKAVPYYTRAKNSEKLIECFYALEDYAGLQTLLNIIPEGQPILHDLGQRFMSVGLCAAAVKAYMKAGDVKAAINCCIFLHQWDQAIQLAENYQYPQIDVLLEKYATYLLERGQQIQAIELFQKAGKYQQAAKMLMGLAQKALNDGSTPVQIKKLYVLAALQVEQMRKHTLQLNSAAATRGGGAPRGTAAAQTLAGLMELDAASADIKDFDNAWRGAEAIHFWMLAHRQLYNGQYDASLKTMLNTLKYDDILNVEEMYSFLALVSLCSKFFAQASKALNKLESLSGTDEGPYGDISFQVFSKNHPTDPRGLKETRTRKANEVQHICIASGAVIADSKYATCPTCKHALSSNFAQSLSICPLCHSFLRA